jgi:hypothetical protein
MRYTHPHSKHWDYSDAFFHWGNFLYRRIARAYWEVKKLFSMRKGKAGNQSLRWREV